MKRFVGSNRRPKPAWIHRVTALAALAVMFGGIQVAQALPANAAGACHASYVAILKSKTLSGPVATPIYYDAAAGSNPGGQHTINCGMWNGMHGPTAGTMYLQKALNRCYGENLVDDGIFGYYTEEALRRAQRDEGIGADGIYGIETARNLKFIKSGGASGCDRIYRPWDTVSPHYSRVYN